jgi:outer membrane lipoprotein-sorting protein
MGKSKHVAVMTLVLIFAGIGPTNGVAVDWPDILKGAKAKYAAFEVEVKDMTIAQQMQMFTPKGEMVAEGKLLKQGTKFRAETRQTLADMPEGMQGMETVVIYDGKDSWLVSSFLGKQKLSANEGRQYQTETNFWDSLPETGELMGDERVGNHECYVVHFKDAEDLLFRKIWLDKEKLFLVKGESQGAPDEAMKWIYSDFKPIRDDWELPYRTETYVNGQLMSVSTVKSIEVNTGLSEKLFNPDEVKLDGLNMQEMLKRMR